MIKVLRGALFILAVLTLIYFKYASANPDLMDIPVNIPNNVLSSPDGFFTDKNNPSVIRLIPLQETHGNNSPKTDFTPYIYILEKNIRKNWNARKSNKYKKITILDGELVSISLLHSSGNKKCDNNAITAIKSLKPFDPLPSEFTGNETYIEFTFDNKALIVKGIKY